MGITNGILDLFCALQTLAFDLAWPFTDRKKSELPEKVFYSIILSVFVMLASDGMALIFLVAYPTVFSVVETISVIASFTVLGLFAYYVVVITKIEKKLRRVILGTVFLICLYCIGIYAVNCVHPFFYSLTEQYYTNDFYYWLVQGLDAVVIVLTAFVLFYGRNKLNVKDFLFLLVTPFLPLLSVLIDDLIPGLRIRYALTFLMIIVNYLRISAAKREKTRKQMEALEQRKVLSTLQRIKPHYIYNVLTSIYYLCDTDAATAKQAIGIFSDYLRDVLDIMESQSLISFEREIRTIANYLDLEQMRFGDQFSVRYQIRAKNFKLPPFCVQPLVENSVKHGVAHAGTVGEIVISSYEKQDGYVIVVRDTFGGFDQSQLGDGGGGSGTNYIREILKLTVNGTLKIESEPGKGTVSMIFIPKN